MEDLASVRAPLGLYEVVKFMRNSGFEVSPVPPTSVDATKMTVNGLDIFGIIYLDNKAVNQGTSVSHGPCRATAKMRAGGRLHFFGVGLEFAALQVQ
jgi:hypothetical protein